jgi:oligopeptide/dipeptide ABC transporter ATP-binding protein
MADVLDVQGLSVSIRRAGNVAPVLDGVSFTVEKGEVLGIVGESGSGKTMLALAIMGLLPAAMWISSGTLRFLGQSLDPSLPDGWREQRGRGMAMVFQEPMTALNPVMRVGTQIKEVLGWRRGLKGAASERRAIELLQQVEIPSAAARLHAYPHELSGGMRQRVMIAMALAGEPQLLIADEPTTALDVTIQAQILRLLRDLQRKLSLSMILITHDLGVIAELADRVMVLYASQTMELASATALFDAPKHPYTAALLAVSLTGEAPQRRLGAIGGTIPPLGAQLPGCRFAPRCLHREQVCESGRVPLAIAEAHHQVACLRPFAYRRDEMEARA